MSMEAPWLFRIVPFAHAEGRYPIAKGAETPCAQKRPGLEPRPFVALYRLIVVRIRSSRRCHRSACGASEERNEHKPDKELRQEAEQGELDRILFRLRKIMGVRKPSEQDGDRPHEKSYDGPSELHASRQMDERKPWNILGARGTSRLRGHSCRRGDKCGLRRHGTNRGNGSGLRRRAARRREGRCLRRGACVRNLRGAALEGVGSRRGNPLDRRFALLLRRRRGGGVLVSHFFLFSL